MDRVTGEGFQQEALAIDFFARLAWLHTHKPSLERAHPTDIIGQKLLRQREASYGRQSPVRGQAREPELGEHQQGERRRHAVAARDGAPVVADRPHSGAVGEAGQQAQNEAQHFRLYVGPWGRLRQQLASPVKSWSLRRPLVEHLTCKIHGVGMKFLSPASRQPNHPPL